MDLRSRILEIPSLFNVFSYLGIDPILHISEQNEKA
jgi:hypothetical protein